METKIESPCQDCIYRMVEVETVPCVCCVRNPIGHAPLTDYSGRFGTHERDYYRKNVVGKIDTESVL